MGARKLDLSVMELVGDECGRGWWNWWVVNVEEGGGIGGGGGRTKKSK